MSFTKPFPSIYSSDQDAEWSFRMNDLAQFIQALESGACVNKRLRRQHYSLFEQACKTPGRSAYIAACIKEGARVRERNPYTEEYPIHLVALSLDPDNLSELLKDRSISVDEKCKERTSLHMLFEKINSENWAQVFDCIKLLLKHDAKLMDENVCPLTEQLGDDTWKKYILDYCFRNKLCSQAKDGKSEPVTIEMLWTQIDAGTEEGFLEAYEKYGKQKDGQELQEKELADLLCRAAYRKKQKEAEKLVENKLDANGKLTFADISLLAGLLTKCCSWGRAEMLEWLLKIIPENAKEVINKESPLTLLVKQIAVNKVNGKSSFYDCMKVLLNDPRVEVNKTDTDKHTALHYALEDKNNQAQELLLAHGAYIGGENVLGNCLLKKHLDSCITDNGLNPDDKKYELHIIFFNFVPPNGKDAVDEMYLIQQIADSPTTKYLLWHPVIATILMLKWNKLFYIFFINFLICFVFGISFASYIAFYYGQADSACKLVFQNLSWAGWVYLFVREFSAAVITGCTYFKSQENLMEVTLIGLSAWMLGWEPTGDSGSFVVISVLLLLGLELTLQIGMWPVNSIYTNMVMLKRVTKNFLKCLGFFAIIMLSFTLSFYTLFRMSAVANQPEKKTTRNDSSEPQFNDFAEIPLSLVKTVVMFTGEFDATNINFKISWAMYLLFLFFLFFVTIVINNLMNGLAVSDTSAIQAESEDVAIAEMVCVIRRHEKILKALNHFPICGNCLPNLQLFNCEEPLQEIIFKPLKSSLCHAYIYCRKLEGQANEKNIKNKNETPKERETEPQIITDGIGIEMEAKHKNQTPKKCYTNGQDNAVEISIETKGKDECSKTIFFKRMIRKIERNSSEILKVRKDKTISLDQRFKYVEQKIEKISELMQTFQPQTNNNLTTVKLN